MHILTVDFETYYDREFSLSRLTTEEYVRDQNFEVIGVGVKINDEETNWYSGTHEEIKAALKKYDWGASLVLAHNTAFDGAILAWRFGITPKGWLDTLCMARAVHGVDVGVEEHARLRLSHGSAQPGQQFRQPQRVDAQVPDALRGWERQECWDAALFTHGAQHLQGRETGRRGHSPQRRYAAGGHRP